jgi:hypothetical protein
MNEKLFSSYLAYTTEEEFGTAATAEAPATAGTLISPWTMMLGC